MATIRELANELMEVVSKVESFGDRNFSIYNIDELAEVGEGAGYPQVAVGYEATNPVGNQGMDAGGRPTGPASAANVNYRFTILVGVEYNWQGEQDSDTKFTATDLLDQVRSALIGLVGVNSRPWRFIAEGPIDTVVDGVIFYAQIWETTSVVKGNKLN